MKLVWKEDAKIILRFKDGFSQQNSHHFYEGFTKKMHYPSPAAETLRDKDVPASFRTWLSIPIVTS